MKEKPSARKEWEEYSLWSDVPIGTLFKVIKNSNTHNYPLNVELTTQFAPHKESGMVILGHNNLRISDVEFLSSTPESIDKRIKDLYKELDELQERQEFLKKHKLTRYSPKIHRAIKYLESLGIYDIKKAEELAEQLK